MNSWLRVLIVSAIGGCCALWLPCTNGSERFYLTVPVLALTIFVTGITDLRSGLKTAGQQLLLMTAMYFVLAVSLASTFFGSPGNLPFLPWAFWLQTAIAFYYFAGLVIACVWMRRLLCRPGQLLDKRWHFTPAVRVILCQVLPAALLILLALPLGLAFSNVHRFKVPNLSDPQQSHGRAFADEEFVSADGTRLRGWWIPARKPSTRTLVICHGVSANRSIFLPFVEVGDWLEANIFMLDMRGHGDSAGHSVTMGCREKDDVLAAIAHVRREHASAAVEVVGLGISLGAASMAQAAADVQPPLDAVILDSCFTSTREMTQAALGAFPAFCHPVLLAIGLPLADLHAGCAMMAVSPEASIERLRAPVLFIHCSGDPLIPAEHSRRLHARAAEPRQLLVFELDGHCLAFSARKSQYREAVLELVKKPATPP